MYSHLVTDVIKPLLAGYSLTIEVQRGLHTWESGWLALALFNVRRSSILHL